MKKGKKELSGRSPNWSIDQGEYFSWLKSKEGFLGPTFNFEDAPSAKMVLFLALLEHQGERVSYQQLRDTIQERGVIVNGEIPLEGLRVALLELDRHLGDHPLAIKKTPLGREARFELVQRHKKTKGERVHATLAEVVQIAPIPDKSKTTDPSSIARSVMRQLVLPPRSIFIPPEAASWWITQSSDEAKQRAKHEADAWTDLAIRTRLKDAARSAGVLCVLGLAVQEGKGSIALLHAILGDPDFADVQVHYLAIDSSNILLAMHAFDVAYQLSEYLFSGRLICSTCLGEVEQPHEAIQKARVAIRKAGLVEFMPIDAPMLATYLGNLIGNNVPESEALFFQTIRDSLHYFRPLECLVGLTVLSKDRAGKPIEVRYKKLRENFLLQLLHELLSAHKVIQSPRDIQRKVARGELQEEFRFPKTDAVTNGDGSDEGVASVPYSSFMGDIHGLCYRFSYTLLYDLEMPSEGLKLAAGTQIQILSITHYEFETVRRCVERLGFKVAIKADQRSMIRTYSGERRYALFSAYLPREEET